MKRIWKIISYTLIFAVAFTAFMGFAHTRSGRPILVWLVQMSGKHEVCPLGFDKVASLGEREQIRKLEAQTSSILPIAKNRNALQFEIGQTTRSELTVWVNAQNGECHEQKASYQLECNGQFFSALSSTLWLEFDSNEKLVSLRGIEKFSDASPALSFYKNLETKLSYLKTPSVQRSGRTKSKDLSGLLAQASVQEKFSNYQASLRITNMGKEFAVTQNFLGY